MARFAIEVPDSAPAKDEPDAMLSRLATRGLDRESALEKKFRDKGLSVVNVQTSLEEQRREPAESELTDATTYTRTLMTEGVDVIAKASLESGTFYGFADFLVKMVIKITPRSNTTRHHALPNQ